MSFIGIITNPKNEEYMAKMLSKDFPIENIIFITNKNIKNIRNIRFQTIAIDKEIKDSTNLKMIVSNANYIILNSDLNIDLEILKNLDLVVISYGFNSKATFTISSVSENNIIICLQRIIKNIFGSKYEPQELEIENTKNVDISAIICVQSIRLMYGKI